jgi:iron complex transport system substrate-binding protein
MRVVSLSPALTESVCALGKCALLVGVDRYSNSPKEVLSLPKLGGGIDPSLEAIVAIKPDLVLMANSSQGAERLQQLGLKVVQLEPKTHAQVRQTLVQLGTLLQVPEQQTVKLQQDIDHAIAQAAAGIPAAAKGKRVYFEVNNAPYAASESSFIGESLKRLGLRNITPGHLGPFPKLNPEFVVRENPELIMVSDRHFAGLKERPGWKTIDAIKQDRICVFSPTEGDSIVRAGPRMAEGAMLLAKCVQAMFK